MKTIYHVGGWHRNYGDFALQVGQMSSLRAVTPEPVDFVPVNCQITRFHPALIDLINERADMLLVGGGGMVFHRPEDDSQSGWQFNIAMEDLDRLAVPLVVYAIGYNRFYYNGQGFKPQMNAHLQATQAKAALFSVRNRGTFEELVSRGLDPGRIEVVPDAGMFVSTSPVVLPDLPHDGFKIGLNWAGDRNFYRFQEPWEETRTRVIDALCEAMLRLLRGRGGGKVVFIPHLSENIDSEVAPLFEARLGEVFYNVEKELPSIFPPVQAQVPFLADIYRQMDLVIGMRGHANIIPFGVGTPVIGLGSHNKNRFFLEQIGEPDNIIDTRSFPECSSAEDMFTVMSRVADDRELKARMADRLTALSAIAEQFNRRVTALL